MRHRKTALSLRTAMLPLAVVLAILPGIARSQSPDGEDQTKKQQDRVKLTEKIDNAIEFIGEIVALGPSSVEIEVVDRETTAIKKAPIDKIREVIFADEPEELRTARKLLARRDAAGAVDELKKFAWDDGKKVEEERLAGASDNVRAEYAFVKAAADARKATITGDTNQLAEGETALREFLQKNPRSHHLFQASEMLGDLLVRAGKFDAAAAAYAALEKGPPAFRVRAATAKGGSFYEQKKFTEAEKEYEAAIKTETDPKDEASARQKREAQAGRARCLARQGKAADAVKALQDVIREADPEDGDLLGRIYTALGDAYRTANKDQDALIAFLTVDLVYNTLPECHAEALYNLVQLWQKAQNPERSREASQSLETSYPNSRWSKALGAAAGKG